MHTPSYAYAIIAAVTATAIVLRKMGRTWGEPVLWTGDTESPHTSQRIADPYTFTHVLHGVLFYWAMAVTPWSFETKILAATALECAWEIAENTERVINRYRTETAAIGYTGDSVVNSIADVIAMLGGFYFAHALPWYASLGLIAIVELALLGMYRDNLTLNIIMLLYPIPRIKAWQARRTD
jgi:hypothetical protein